MIMHYVSHQRFDRPEPTQPTMELDYKALENLDMVILGLIVEREDIKRGAHVV